MQLIMHTDCGMEGLDQEVVERSLGPFPLDLLGFGDVREELRRGVDRIRDVQLLDLRGGATGHLFDVTTGLLQPSVS